MSAGIKDVLAVFKSSIKTDTTVFPKFKCSVFKAIAQKSLNFIDAL